MTALTFIDTHAGYFPSPKIIDRHQNSFIVTDKTISYNDSH